jgi:hypothetical protein
VEPPLESYSGGVFRTGSYEIIIAQLFDNLAGGGHVVHAEARRFNDTFAISFAPFLVGATGCAPLPSAAGILYRNGAPFWIVEIGLWLALSIVMHAGPSPLCEWI